MKFSWSYPLVAGLIISLTGACARQSQKRSSSEAASKRNSEIGNSSEGASDASGGDSGTIGNGTNTEALSDKELGDAKKKLEEKELGSLSLAEQCSVYGEDWSFDANKQSCYKSGDKKSSADICKTKGENWIFIESTGQCATAPEKQNLQDVCKAKGESWVYDENEKSCYLIAPGSVVDLAKACAEKSKDPLKGVSRLDPESGNCNTYGNFTDAPLFCTEKHKGTWDADAKKCTLPDGSVVDPADPKFLVIDGETWVYNPETGKMEKLEDVSNPENLCANKSDNSRYNAEKKSCVTVQDQTMSNKLCSDLGEKWVLDDVSDQCVQVTEGVDVLKVCESDSKKCTFNPVTGEWEVVEGERTTEALCTDRGDSWVWDSAKNLCMPKSQAETITDLGNGIYQDADGNKYRNVLNLGQGIPVGSFWGLTVPDYRCSDRAHWLPKLRPWGYYWQSWAYSYDDDWVWNNRNSDSEYWRVCGGPQASGDDRNLECPEGYMIESIAAQGNLLNGVKFMNFIKIKCTNFDKRVQGQKAGYSNDESSLKSIRCSGFSEVITGFKLTKNFLLNNIELECAPLNMEKLTLSGDPVSLDLPLLTGDSVFTYDFVGDVYGTKSCNSSYGYKNKVLTGIRIKAQKLFGNMGKPDNDNEYEWRQEWVAYSIQPVCGELSRSSVLLDAAE